MVVDPRWVLAVDFGTTTTLGSTAEVDPADGWVRVGTVLVDGAAAVPSVVLSRPDGTVLAGRSALDAAPGDPAAAVLRARSYLASATGGPQDAVLTRWPRPTTAVDVATALVARVLHTEAARRRTLPSSLVLTHPAAWSGQARGALRAAGLAVLAAVPHATPDLVALLPSPEAAAVRLGGRGPLVVVDIGGGGTEVAVVDRSDAGGAGGSTAATARPGARLVDVGGEALDDALAHRVLDRARPELAMRIRFGGDLDAHRAWFTLRLGIRAAKERLGAVGSVEVPLPVLPPESPYPSTVTLSAGDLGQLFAPGLEQVGAAVTEVVGAERMPMLVRGGMSDMAGVRDWLARRTGSALAHGEDTGAVSTIGVVSGASAWGAARLGLGHG
jgi:molecular chaperone DnaK (HSP70)